MEKRAHSSVVEKSAMCAEEGLVRALVMYLCMLSPGNIDLLCVATFAIIYFLLSFSISSMD